MDWPLDSDFKGFKVDGLRSVPPNLPHRSSRIGHAVKFLFSRNGATAQRKLKNKKNLNDKEKAKNHVASLRRGVKHFLLIDKPDRIAP